MDFICLNCQKLVSESAIGTKNRNHCPFCLWSKHVDKKTAGDRASKCLGPMQPIGLTFKHEGFDKYTGKPKQGEIMVVHLCTSCGKININRIAGDDDIKKILDLVNKPPRLSHEVVNELEKQTISLLTKNDSLEMTKQLFGKLS